jgi:hypothetical protein
MSYVEHASAFKSGIQELSLDEIGCVGGGSLYAPPGSPELGYSSHVDWARVGRVLRQFSDSFHNGSEAVAALAVIAAVSALSQAGLDAPNDVVAVALGVAAAAGEATSWAIGILATATGQ